MAQVTGQGAGWWMLEGAVVTIAIFGALVAAGGWWMRRRARGGDAPVDKADRPPF